MEVGVFYSHAYPFVPVKLSQTVEEQILTNKLSLVPFLFLYFPFLLQFILLLFLFFVIHFSPSAFVDPY